MTSKLCSMFFGDKKFREAHYELYQSMKDISQEEVHDIFAPYTHTLKTIASTEDQNFTLLNLFAEFIRQALKKFSNWNFQKLSSWIEIAAHVFEYSFEQNLSKKQSFNYFAEVLVRHSLFRPPHSVEIFTFDECQEIKQYWLKSFCRFYEEYALCFSISLNEKIITKSAGFTPLEEKQIEGKIISREDFASKFSEIIDINLNQKKQADESQ